LPPLAAPSFNVGANWVGQRGQATLPYLFVSSFISVMIVGLMCFLSGEGLQTRTGRSRPNRSPVITSFSSSPNTVVRCKLPTQFDCTGEDVSLSVVATDPDGDKLTYRYTVSGGTTMGQGASVKWILKDVPNGSFVAQVFVTDGRGGESMSELPLVVTDGPIGEAFCPTIFVGCPESVSPDQHSMFKANVTGGPAGVPITYHWSVLRGKIVRGQDTNQLEVETVDRGQESITAMVQIGGFDSDCPAQASCTTNIVRWELLAPPCPSDPVKVTCPSGLDVNRRVVFSAIITAAEPPKTVTYYWTVNWGKIISGQGTPQIEVEHKEKWGEKLTATVHLGGYDPSCFAQASCSVALE